MSARQTRAAEFVFPGHPDKLADAIADAVVGEARRRERRALVGVEVAVYGMRVVLNGRVACRDAHSIDLGGIARSVYASAGYGGAFPPSPGTLDVTADVRLEALRDGEAAFREVACDQSIVTGYAVSNAGTGHLPVEQALARRLARRIGGLWSKRPELGLGPDGKLIVLVEESGDPPRWRPVELSVSVQHRADHDPVAARRAIREAARREFAAFAAGVRGFEPGEGLALAVNEGGDFIEGGPFGDNGQTGRKLVMDFYGPRVPIGGGALSGKDFYSADRAGAMIARRLAVSAVTRLALVECLVTIAIRPGERAFRLVSATGPGHVPLDLATLEGRIDLALRTIGDGLPLDLDHVELARFGHFTSDARSL